LPGGIIALSFPAGAAAALKSGGVRDEEPLPSKKASTGMKRPRSVDELDEDTLRRMLEEADKLQVQEIDGTRLKQLLLALEKRINANQRMRVKHANSPEKFLDSEVDLDEAVRELAPLATGGVNALVAWHALHCVLSLNLLFLQHLPCTHKLFHWVW
jgi:hypothetical protein